MTRRRPPATLFILFDESGEPCGVYETREEATDDACGPRFRRFRVREYLLMVELKGKP